MTKKQKNLIRKQLREQGFQSKIIQHSKSWRITVTASEKVCVTPVWQRDEQGQRHIVEKVWCQDRATTVRLAETPLLCWFRQNGFPHVKTLRISASDIMFELDHKHNLWKILQNFL